MHGNSYYLSSTFFVPDTVLHFLPEALIIKVVQRGSYHYYPHFRNEKNRKAIFQHIKLNTKDLNLYNLTLEFLCFLGGNKIIKMSHKDAWYFDILLEKRKKFLLQILISP